VFGLHGELNLLRFQGPYFHSGEFRAMGKERSLAGSEK